MSPFEEFVIINGQDPMKEYTVKILAYTHVFCIMCGVHAHHQSRTSPEKLYINIGFLDGFDPTLHEHKK